MPTLPFSDRYYYSTWSRIDEYHRGWGIIIQPRAHVTIYHWAMGWGCGSGVGVLFFQIPKPGLLLFSLELLPFIIDHHHLLLMLMTLLYHKNIIITLPAGPVYIYNSIKGSWVHLVLSEKSIVVPPEDVQYNLIPSAWVISTYFMSPIGDIDLTLW